MAAKRGRQAYRGGERRSWPAWVWLALGTAFGVILSVVVLYGGKLPTLRGKNLPQPNPDATAPKESEQALADEAKKTAPPKSNFDFYSVLPEKEVVIPDAELTAKAKAEQARAQQQAQAAAAAGTPPAPPPAPAAGGGNYMLQVVATGDARAADEFKARLAMLGFAAKVYTSTSDGKTIHRVRLGPYASALETEAAKKSLSENSINSFPVADAPKH